MVIALSKHIFKVDQPDTTNNNISHSNNECITNNNWPTANKASVTLSTYKVEYIV